jgi:hypothetical protein
MESLESLLVDDLQSMSLETEMKLEVIQKEMDSIRKFWVSTQLEEGGTQLPAFEPLKTRVSALKEKVDALSGWVTVGDYLEELLTGYYECVEEDGDGEGQ